MLTSNSWTLVDGAMLCSLSNSGSTLPNQAVTSPRSEFNSCHCCRSSLTSISRQTGFWTCSSSQRSMTPVTVTAASALSLQTQSQSSSEVQIFGTLPEHECPSATPLLRPASSGSDASSSSLRISLTFFTLLMLLLQSDISFIYTHTHKYTWTETLYFG